MDIRFQANNTHLDRSETFAKTDPHLKRLYAEKWIYHSPIIKMFPQNQPGIITLGGGRQIGKTTMLKQWMEYLLKKGVLPQSICFFSCELVGDYQSLYTLVVQQLGSMPAGKLKYLILDEITYIEDWDKAIKYLADTGVLDDTLVVLTGSDLVLMQDARKRFPGRRGKIFPADFHYYPLSFKEYLQLTSANKNQSLNDAFSRYLIHGGFLSAINEFEKTKLISNATLCVYADWIRGDVLKRGKKEIFLREVIESILKNYTKQVSWDALTKELSINHTQTIVDYVDLLSSMDAVFVQSALIEDKLKAAPKKRKKLMFCDPFIYHAMNAWLYPTKNPYEQQIKPLLENSIHCSELVESCVITHFRRYFPTYYIKSEGEVDVAYIKNKKFYPVEVKWTNQLRVNDLKQILKYKNAEIYAKVNEGYSIQNTPVIPLPSALSKIGDGAEDLEA